MPLRRPACLVLLTLLLAPPPRAASASDLPDSLPRLRTTDDVVASIVDRGRASSLFRSLLHTLQSGDVIVYVERSLQGRSGTATTQLIGSAGPVRFARITLILDTADDKAAALLGHELQHVVELAAAPWVRTQADYLTLYRAIGESRCQGPLWCFDTRAARDAGRLIWRELRRRTGPPHVNAE